MKRVNPGILDRLKAGKVAGVGSCISAATLSGGAFAALGWTGGAILAVVAGGGIVVGLGVAFVRGRLTYIPKSVIDDIGHDKKCKLTRVSAQELKEACDLTRPYYKHEYVEFSIADKWRRKNPEAFAELKNEDGDLCSCFSFISMRDSCFEEFIRGRLKDAEFTEDDILGPKETKSSNRLYLGGVIVNGAGTYMGSKRASMMSSAMLHYYKKYFRLNRQRTLYALAASDEGEHLLREMDFTLASKKNDRKDQCNLYSKEMNASAWNGMMQKIPDWSRCYTVEL